MTSLFHEVSDPTPAPPLQGRGVPTESISPNEQGMGVPTKSISYHEQGRGVPADCHPSGKAVAAPLPLGGVGVGFWGWASGGGLLGVGRVWEVWVK